MRKYVIINDPGQVEINWSALDQSSREDCEECLLNQRFLISYTSEEPPEFLEEITDKSPEYTKEEVIPLLVDPDWAVYVSLVESDTSEEDEKIQYYTDNI